MPRRSREIICLIGSVQIRSECYATAGYPHNYRNLLQVIFIRQGARLYRSCLALVYKGSWHQVAL